MSVRTLRRDFRERLAYLDTEFRNGQCRLLSGSRQRELTVQTLSVSPVWRRFSGYRQPTGQLSVERQRVSLPYLAQHQRQDASTA